MSWTIQKLALLGLEALGAGVLTYSAFYLLTICFVDCDLELTFYSLFGKSPSTYIIY